MKQCKDCLHATYEGMCTRHGKFTLLDAGACAGFAPKEKAIAVGSLYMAGNKVEWPPRDIDGTPIHLGDKVFGTKDTFNGQHEHEFIVGAIRLQITCAHLMWVVCAYEDDTSYYFECFAEDCKVLGGIPY